MKGLHLREPLGAPLWKRQQRLVTMWSCCLLILFGYYGTRSGGRKLHLLQVHSASRRKRSGQRYVIFADGQFSSFFHPLDEQFGG
jgi:hypothetical protein